MKYTICLFWNCVGARQRCMEVIGACRTAYWPDWSSDTEWKATKEHVVSTRVNLREIAASAWRPCSEHERPEQMHARTAAYDQSHPLLSLCRDSLSWFPLTSSRPFMQWVHYAERSSAHQVVRIVQSSVCRLMSRTRCRRALVSSAVRMCFVCMCLLIWHAAIRQN